MADIEINKSDIDEVNDVIQETDEEAYALECWNLMSKRRFLIEEKL